MIILTTIIKLNEIVASKADLNLLNSINESKNLTKDFNYSLLDKKVDQFRNLYFYDICSTILTKLFKDVDNLLKFNFLRLRDSVLKCDASLNPSQNQNFLNLMFCILIELEELWNMYASYKENKIKTVLVFLDFNTHKNKIREQVYKRLQVVKDENIKFIDESDNEKEEVKLTSDKETNLITEKNKKCNYFVKKESDLTTDKDGAFKNSDNLSCNEFDPNLFNDNNDLSIKNKIVLSLEKKLLQKALDNAKLRIRLLLLKYNNYLFEFIDKTHEKLKSTVKFNILRGHMDGCIIARNFVDHTIMKIKNDLKEIFDKYENELIKHLLD